MNKMNCIFLLFIGLAIQAPAHARLLDRERPLIPERPESVVKPLIPEGSISVVNKQSLQKSVNMESLIQSGLREGIRQVMEKHGNNPAVQSMLDDILQLTLTDCLKELLCLIKGYEYHFEGSCYIIKTNKKNFNNAKADCQAQGTHLAIINNDCEFQYLTARVTEPAWIGLSDQQKEGNYKWVDGTTHTPSNHRNWWNPAQPDNYRGQQDCIQIFYRSNAWTLDDYWCSRDVNYICEKKL